MKDYPEITITLDPDELAKKLSRQSCRVSARDFLVQLLCGLDHDLSHTVYQFMKENPEGETVQCTRCKRNMPAKRNRLNERCGHCSAILPVINANEVAP